MNRRALSPSIVQSGPIVDLMWQFKFTPATFSLFGRGETLHDAASV